MNENSETDAMDELPTPQVARRKRWSLSLVWLVPLLAVVVGLTLVVNAYLSVGPTISVSFETAEGIEAGKTQVRYKNVVIGKVATVELGKDRLKVLVGIELEKKYAGFASAGSRFWVVRPRIGFGGVSGLGTLLSGAYIGADTTGSDEFRDRFTGLETPPPLTNGELGSSFVLRSKDLGSLDIGSPVYFRRIQVGRVVAYELDPGGEGVNVQVFVAAPNDKFVTRDSRFWNASGVSVTADASGFKLSTESLTTVLAGGVAFEAPPSDAKVPRAPQGTRFQLFDEKALAMKPADGPPVVLRMRFPQSVRGLSVGAPIDFQGINLGEVKAISADFDAERKRFPIDVTAVVYPQRLGRAHERFVERTEGKYADNPGALLAILVRHGLRAQMRNGNLLTGQLYVALDFFPRAPKAELDPTVKPLAVPTMPGSFDRIQEQMAHIVDKLDKVPFDEIGMHLNDTLRDLDTLVKQVNGEVVPELKGTLEQARGTLESLGQSLSADSPLQHNLGQTLNELQRAARSLRVLSDYLGRHPESLIRGRQNREPAPYQPPQSPPQPIEEGTP